MEGQAKPAGRPAPNARPGGRAAMAGGIRQAVGRKCPSRTELARVGGVALGRQRLGVNLISRIATLREEGRLPIRSIQWYLRTVHQLRLSVGAIVSAIHQTAQQAQPAVAAILDRIRASPVVHADETGWRQNGNNGYVWTFSTPTERYFLRRGRGKAVVDEALSESFSGVLVSDCYAAYHHYDGPKQRCWAHLLRDIHDLVALYPKDTALAQWAAAVHQLYVEAGLWTFSWPDGGSVGDGNSSSPSGWEWQGSQSSEGATELVFPGPALGKMQSEAAGGRCRTGEPSGHREEASSEGLGGHHRLAQTEARRPAGQVVGDDLDGQPGAALAAKRPEGRWLSPTPYLRSRMAFSISAWRRWSASSARVSPSRSVMKP